MTMNACLNSLGLDEAYHYFEQNYGHNYEIKLNEKAALRLTQAY